MTYKLSDNAKDLQHSLKPDDYRIQLSQIASHLKSGYISKEEAVMLTTPEMLDGVMFSSLANRNEIDDSSIIKRHNLGTPGAATGKVALTTEQADEYIANDEPFILALPQTLTKHNDYIEAAAGTITFNGGIASHASITARQKGKPALIGTGKIELEHGQTITIDGSKGLILEGEHEIIPADKQNHNLHKILEIADSLEGKKAHKIKIKANADNEAEAEEAIKFGATGIGVVRTENMFGKDRLPIMQSMIMAGSKQERMEQLDKLAPMQKQDFKEIFQVMAGKPVTVRLLDEPLHEFMPDIEKPEELQKVADTLNISPEDVESRTKELKEENSMLGMRAVRLAMAHPEIYEMQIRSMLEASDELRTQGVDVQPQIMIPLVQEVYEVEFVQEIIKKVADEMAESSGHTPKYKVGIMVETPAAADLAKEMVEVGKAEFFSVGSNDLTQMTHGFSRDDVGTHIDNSIEYVKSKGGELLDVFQTISAPVSKAIERAITGGRDAKPDLEVSICGEHGGDPASIHIAQKLGVDTISVSPPRLPTARLVAAQAMLEREEYLNLHTSQVSEKNSGWQVMV